jgi:hypothetical protein
MPDFFRYAEPMQKKRSNLGGQPRDAFHAAEGRATAFGLPSAVTV